MSEKRKQNIDSLKFWQGVSVDDIDEDSSTSLDENQATESGKGVGIEIKYDSPKKREKRLEFWLRRLKEPSNGPVDDDAPNTTGKKDVNDSISTSQNSYSASYSRNGQKAEYFHFIFNSTSPCSVHREASPHSEFERCVVVSYEISLNILGFVVQIEKHSMDFNYRIHVVNQSLSLNDLQQQMKWDLLNLLADFHATPKATINELVHFLKVLCKSYSRRV